MNKTSYLLTLLIFLIFSESTGMDVKWRIDHLEKPESVVYDMKSDCLYVSNINGGALELDKNGFISKISITGKVIEKEWVTGLDGPKGLAISNNNLYVADINKIWKISLSDRSKKFYKVNDTGFLNDLTVDKLGNIYASDMTKNRIYMLRGNQVNIWKTLLFSPNGLLVDKENLIVAQWGSTTEDFETKTTGYLVKIDLKTREISRFFSTRPIGNLDGLVFNKDKGYLATDWVKGKVFSIDNKGIAKLEKKMNKGAADLEIVVHKNLLLIPAMLDNSLIAFSLK